MKPRQYSFTVTKAMDGQFVLTCEAVIEPDRDLRHAPPPDTYICADIAAVAAKTQQVLAVKFGVT